MSDERTLNKQLARLLGGKDHVRHGRYEVDVEVGRWVIECSFGKADAINNAKGRIDEIEAAVSKLVAVVYPDGTSSLKGNSKIEWFTFRDGGAKVVKAANQTVAGLRSRVSVEEKSHAQGGRTKR